MHSHRRQSLIGRAGEWGGLPRRRLLQSAGALGLTAILRPTVALAEPGDEGERLGPFGPWSMPHNLAAVVNQSRTTDLNTHPGISKNGLSLYISSTRPGGVTGANIGNNPTGFLELWVSKRASLKAPWGAPSSIASKAMQPSRAFRRLGICCSSAVTARVVAAATISILDLYVTTRAKLRDDEADEQEPGRRR